MAATVSISETNGAGGTVTASITNTNMGSVDAVNLDPVTYPIDAGENSYTKYQRFNVTNMGGSSAIKTLKVWRTGDLGGSATHVTNAGETTDYTAKTYATPTTSSVAGVDNILPITEPSTANLGIGSSLTGVLTDIGYSDYLVHQIVTDAADIAGSTSTLNFQYDEVA